MLPFGSFFSEQGYKDALMEVQALRVNCNTEFKRREALESHITDLKKGQPLQSSLQV